MAAPYAKFEQLSPGVCRACRQQEKLEKSNRQAAVREATLALIETIPAAKARAGVNTAHLAWVRKHPCACHNVSPCQGPGAVIHAHHVRNGTGGGMGMKPHDRWTVPLCAMHHNELHARGHATFEARYGIDLRAIAVDLARFSPHIERPAS